MLKEIFNEVKLNSRVRVKLTSSTEESFIYKGFKISHIKESDTYQIVDCRFSDFYQSLKKPDSDMIMTHGFVKGCDIITMNRDVLRIEKYKRIITRLFDNKNKATNPSRIKTLTNQLNEATDLFFFYQTRYKQLKSKYNEE